MGSPLFQLDLLTAHEPEMRKCLEINECIFRFMERASFLIQTLPSGVHGGPG